MTAALKTFTTDTPAGTFTFYHRTMRLEMAIQADYSRLVEGLIAPVPSLELMATWTATLKCLTHAGPDDWDIDKMDPLDPATYTKLKGVFDALRAKEDEFRGKPRADGAPQRQEGVAEPGVQVPAAVQPAADGPQVS